MSAINLRIQNNYDYENNWNALTDFIPLEGEIIIYAAEIENDSDVLKEGVSLPSGRTIGYKYPRIKIGDGKTLLQNLHFMSDQIVDSILEEVPSHEGTLEYNGTTQAPRWKNYDNKKLILQGQTSAVDAGEYAVYFTPYPGFIWEDTFSGGKQVKWSILPAENSIILNSTNFRTAIGRTYEYDIDVKYNSALLEELLVEVLVDNSISTFVEVSIDTNSKKLKITGKSGNDGIIKLTLPASNNYAEHVIEVPVSCAKHALELYSWKEIQEIAKTGNAAAYFAVGDMKKITLDGRFIDTNIHKEVYVYIMGINYQSDLNNFGIDFGTFKLEKGTDVCFELPKNFEVYQNNKVFTDNDSWMVMKVRYSGLGSTDKINSDATDDCAKNPVKNSLMSTLPEDLRNVMQKLNIASETWGQSNDLCYSKDFLPLLDIKETQSNVEQAFEYYKNGNSTKKYDINEYTKPSYHMFRTALTEDEENFIVVENAASTDPRGGFLVLRYYNLPNRDSSIIPNIHIAPRFRVG